MFIGFDNQVGRCGRDVELAGFQVGGGVGGCWKMATHSFRANCQMAKPMQLPLDCPQNVSVDIRDEL